MASSSANPLMHLSSEQLHKCHESHQSLLLSLTWTLLAVATIAVVCRLGLRFRLHNGIRGDDHFIVAALVAGVVGSGFVTVLVRAGVGLHIYCIPRDRVPVVIKWSMLAQMVNIIGIGLVKISVCLCVLRLIDRARKQLNVFLWILIAFCVLSHLAQVILFVVQCRPMSANWDHHVQGRCFSAHVTYLAGYIGFGLDAFTDLACAGIPIFVIHRLQLDKPTKIALCGVMGVGALTSTCAIAKAVLLKELFEVDYTWAIYKPAICTIIEHLLGVIIASVPALKPIYSKAVAKFKSSEYLGKRRFRKPYGSDGSLPSHGSTLVNSTSGTGLSPPPDEKFITMTREVYIDVGQYLNRKHREQLFPAHQKELWGLPGFPAPPQPAMEKSRPLIV